MYLDAVIVVALIIFSICWFRKFSKFVYALGIIDIFLRLLNYIANHIGIKNFDTWVNTVFPNSILNVIEKYSSGILELILVWVYIALMVFFLFYAIKTFLRKKI